MATTATITLWFTVFAALLALVAVILLAIDLSRNRCTVITGCTGGTGCTGLFLAASSVVLNAEAAGPSTEGAYGDGSAGDALFEGQTGLVLMSDAQYRNLTLNNSVLETNGYRLFVAGTLTLTGGSMISNRGWAGEGAQPDVPSSDGGWGAAAGTLGGGGHGGYGLLVPAGGAPTSEEDAATMAGGGVAQALWGVGDTSLFAGANAVTSERAAPGQQAGLGGAVSSDRARVLYEAAQALNPRVKPVVPLLSGGSGGGGGHGLAGSPGSGGGGGGGVVVIAARQLVVPLPAGASIDVSGGNAGPLPPVPASNRLANAAPPAATSGGGGGGGLALVATESAPASYAGLVLNVSGGSGVDADGSLVMAAPGRAVFWFAGAPAGSNANTNPYAHIRATNVDAPAQTLPSDAATTVLFPTVGEASLGLAFDPDSGSVMALNGGIYNVTAHVCIKPGVPVAGWFRRNGDDAVRHGYNQSEGAVLRDGTQYLALSASMRLDAGDAVDVQLLQTSGADTVIGGLADSPCDLALSLAVPLFGSS